jgi:hypothetical protein
LQHLCAQDPSYGSFQDVLRLAKVLEARYGRGVASAAVLVAASSAYASVKQGAVLVAGAATAIGACS